MTSIANLVPPAVVSRATADKLDVFGVQVEILLTAEATGGALSTYYLECERGTGAPDHVHHVEDESFFVVEGEFEVRTGDRLRRVTAGEQVFLPREVPHKFTCLSEHGKLLGMGTPGGHEHFFRDADELMRSGRFDPQTAAELCGRHGLDVLPPLV